ncbi:putative RING zinc finger domain superfamily protein [Panicum miliaceum]|uniref:RING zinc finger domain superfamily protein n=1 Tax=Panicum miliaceum TaxID=4540 RepID=A0A3L6PJX0_PANMI|nr:putative RING zinc finger domain superfamily protein [Panicum miliaceum]
MTSWSTLTSPAAYKSPAFIALVTVLCVALVLLLHHCVLVACCRGGSGAERRRRRQHHHRRGASEGEDEEEEVSVSVEVSAATSRTHLVQAAAASPAVVCRYRKEEAWKEPTCAVCLADFDDGEAVRVLPECMHYFHAECIDSWLRGSTSCPMCRAETTPTPSPASMHHHHHRRRLELSVSLEEILVRT